MADVHRRLVAGNFLKKLDLLTLAVAVSPIMGDVNYVHPFREGNGRTQMIYLKQLTARRPCDRPYLDRTGHMDERFTSGSYGPL
jgi:cell filamentation protein